MRPLSNVIEIIDRSIYKVIEDVAVENNYAVRKSDYLSDPNGFQQAEEAIANSRGFCVGIFGSNSPQQRGDLAMPRIVIDGKRFVPGYLGGNPDRVYDLNPDTDLFDASVIPPLTHRYQFEIILYSVRVAEDRILHAIIDAALPNFSYVPFYNNPDLKFFVEQYSFRENPDFSLGYEEKTYLYEAPEVFKSSDLLVQRGISPIKSVAVDQKINSTGESLNP